MPPITAVNYTNIATPLGRCHTASRSALINCSAFLDRPNGPIIAAACGPDGAIRPRRSKNAAHILGTRLN